MNYLALVKKAQEKKKKLSQKQLWQLQHIRAINERRACFRKWVYIRNRCYIAGAIGYGLYYLYNYMNGEYEALSTEELKTDGVIDLPWSLVGVRRLLPFSGDHPAIEVDKAVVTAKGVTCEGVISSMYPQWVVT